ncbi:hypothetical protein LZ32DRAFT_226935 [Colletotrichum eremochloae]|nr:hypothetical protein LZ32DRAFT_226935 [Colletotrichum eremochloae]
MSLAYKPPPWCEGISRLRLPLPPSLPHPLRGGRCAIVKIELDTLGEQAVATNKEKEIFRETKGEPGSERWRCQTARNDAIHPSTAGLATGPGFTAGWDWLCRPGSGVPAPCSPRPTTAARTGHHHLWRGIARKTLLHVPSPLDPAWRKLPPQSLISINYELLVVGKGWIVSCEMVQVWRLFAR